MDEIDLDDSDAADGLDWWGLASALTGMPPLSASALVALAGVAQRVEREAGPDGGWVRINESAPVVALAALALTEGLREHAQTSPDPPHHHANALRRATPHAAAALLSDHDSARRVAALRPPATGNAVAPTGRWLRTRGEDVVGTLRPEDAEVLDTVLAGQDALAFGPNGTEVHRGDEALTWLRGRALTIVTQLGSHTDADPLLTAPHVWQTINQYGLRLGWYDCPSLPPLPGPDAAAG